MAWWERIIYVAALAFWRAYFDALVASKTATTEAPTDADHIHAQRFHDAVERLRERAAGGAGSDGTAPGGVGG